MVDFFFFLNIGEKPFQNLLHFLVDGTEKIINVFQNPVSESQGCKNYISKQYFYMAFLNFC